MNRSESINELAMALAKAQGQMQSADKDATNPHFKSKYATLASVWDAARAPLANNQLSISQPVTNGVVTTILMHSSGQWISSDMPLILSKNDMQGMGSAISYARRFAMSAMIGITQDDDDGNAAVANGPVKEELKEDKYPKKISDAQKKRMYAIATKVKITDSAVKSLLKKYNYESSNDILFQDYDKIVLEIESYKPESNFEEMP